MMAMRSNVIAVLLVSLLGCDKGSRQPGWAAADAAPAEPPIAAAMPPEPTPAALPGIDAASAAEPAAAPTATTGTITGVIKLDGAAPAMPLLDRSRDSNCPQSEARAA